MVSIYRCRLSLICYHSFSYYSLFLSRFGQAIFLYNLWICNNLVFNSRFFSFVVILLLGSCWPCLFILVCYFCFRSFCDCISSFNFFCNSSLFCRCFFRICWFSRLLSIGLNCCFRIFCWFSRFFTSSNIACHLVCRGCFFCFLLRCYFSLGWSLLTRITSLSCSRFLNHNLLYIIRMDNAWF